MVTLDGIRPFMKKKLTEDKNIHAIEVRADTLEECLADASVQLETKTHNLEYEVLEKGSVGIIGLMKKPWKILVYENPEIVRQKKEEQGELGIDDNELEIAPVVVDTDGAFYVHRFGSHLYLKIVPPVGKGKSVAEKDVLSVINYCESAKFDESLVKSLCMAPNGTDGKYSEIGSYDHLDACDAILAVDISKDEMEATICVSAPQPQGSEITAENIHNALRIQGVQAGIDEERINAYVDTPVYDEPYVVASAIQPVNGRDAYIAYNFETDRSKLKLKETGNGQVDFKELNLIQNVVAGQPLATKMLPQRGKGGKTVLGRYLEAKNGKDINIPLGQNVKLDSDGRTIVAECAGHVMLVSGKITVEQVYEVKSVGSKTGNIDFMGTVVCKGDVQDGYSIKAAGNIEVYGSVEKCHLEADGDIVISQGVMGRDEGEIICGKTLWARFIQNAKVEAGENVVVNDSIINSEVSAKKKIILKGKRASIKGGHLFATEEILAKDIGSAGGGNETLLEVGFDPEARKRLLELSAMKTNFEKEQEEIKLNIETLENQKKIRRSLPAEKEEKLNEFKSKNEELKQQIGDKDEEIQNIQSHLHELKVVGRVSASGTVYPGVKITVRDAILEPPNEYKAVSFFYDKGFVRMDKYSPSQNDGEEGADGYTTN